MTKSIYLYRDIKSGEYELFGVMVNDDVAIRAFKHACLDPNVFRDDLELYRSANIETRNGKVMICDDSVGYATEGPIFICGGKDVQE